MADEEVGGRSAGSKGCGGAPPPPPPATRFVCENGRPCEACVRYHAHKDKEKGREAKRATGGSSASDGSGRSFSPGESDHSSSKKSSFNNSSSKKSSSEKWTSGGSQSISVNDINEGMETKEWGGVDSKTDLRCHHGKHPRRLLCWDGKNTRRRYLACPLKGKENMCDFVEWIDDKWPPMFQKVASSI